MELTKDQENFVKKLALEHVITNIEDYDGDEDLFNDIVKIAKSDPTRDFEEYYQSDSYELTTFETYPMSIQDVQCDIETWYNYFLEKFEEFSNIK